MPEGWQAVRRKILGAGKVWVSAGELSLSIAASSSVLHFVVARVHPCTSLFSSHSRYAAAMRGATMRAMRADSNYIEASG